MEKGCDSRVLRAVRIVAVLVATIRNRGIFATEMTVEEIVKEIASNPLTDVTFSGGDPFFKLLK